jgi:hypothetical protein
MACPTCDHTMQNIGVCHPPYEKVPVFWCPRCGTLKANVVTGEDEVPKLVGRVAEFASYFTVLDDQLIDRFERLGLRESICVEA